MLVHHDTNRYDLTVKTAHGTAVIDTTTTHLFWDSGTRQWVKAAALGHGTHLQTPDGRATVLGGYGPKERAGWMWDLSITHDHDFYVEVAATPVLVHNCVAFGPAPENAWSTFDQVSAKGSPLPGYKGGSIFLNTGQQGSEILPSTTPGENRSLIASGTSIRTRQALTAVASGS